MSLSPISSNILNLLSTEPVTSVSPVSHDLPSGGSFSDIFKEAMDNVVDTDITDKSSSVALLAGQADDMSGLLLDAQKAEIALNLSLQIRTKVLEAYKEIMQMQV